MSDQSRSSSRIHSSNPEAATMAGAGSSSPFHPPLPKALRSAMQENPANSTIPPFQGGTGCLKSNVAQRLSAGRSKRPLSGLGPESNSGRVKPCELATGGPPHGKSPARRLAPESPTRRAPEGLSASTTRPPISASLGPMCSNSPMTTPAPSPANRTSMRSANSDGAKPRSIHMSRESCASPRSGQNPPRFASRCCRDAALAAPTDVGTHALGRRRSLRDGQRRRQRRRNCRTSLPRPGQPGCLSTTRQRRE